MKSEFIIAVHALVYMAHVKRSVSSEELATNICANAVSIRTVMSKLKKASIILTKEGKNGGYQLNRSDSQIKLSEIADCLETSFISSAWRSGNIDLPCVISSGMKQAMDESFNAMEAQCHKYLETKSIADIQTRLFQIQKEKGENYVNRTSNHQKF